MFYQADWLLPLESPPIPQGWIHVEQDQITAMGAEQDLPPEAEIRKYSGCVLLPGFINAHCHLELTALKNRLPPGLPFSTWAGQLRAFTAALDSSDYRSAAREGVAQLLRGGTTTVVDVGNSGAALPVLSESPLRSFAFVETLGLDPALASSRFSHAAALAGKDGGNASRFRTGVAPHAAYSCSPTLLAAVIKYQQDAGLPFTIHASESLEEEELFASASGSLQEYCRGIFQGTPEHRGATPIRWLESEGLLPDHALIVHGNHLGKTDMDILLRRKATVVHCPSSHAFFGHKPFPFSELRERGIPVCLGTDSQASGDSLSMPDQIRLFRKNFPEVMAPEALRMATVIPAKSLGMEGELGVLRAGCKADFIAIRCITSENEAPCEAVIKPGAEVVLSAIAGKEARLE